MRRIRRFFRGDRAEDRRPSGRERIASRRGTPNPRRRYLPHVSPPSSPSGFTSTPTPPRRTAPALRGRPPSPPAYRTPTPPPPYRSPPPDYASRSPPPDYSSLAPPPPRRTSASSPPRFDLDDDDDDDGSGSGLRYTDADIEAELSSDDYDESVADPSSPGPFASSFVGDTTPPGPPAWDSSEEF